MSRLRTIALAAWLAIAACTAAPGPHDARSDDIAVPDATAPRSCVRDLDCPRADACGTVAQCVAGRCAPLATCDDGVACTRDSCDAFAAACRHEPLDAACDDGDGCTMDRCDPAQDGSCVHVLIDRDHDGVVDQACVAAGAPGDCDDTDPAIRPGVAEICDDDRDNDCDGRADIEDVAHCGLPANERCATARGLRGPGAYIGSTAGLARDYPEICPAAPGAAPAADALYTFTLAAQLDVALALDNSAPLGASLALWGGDCEPLTGAPPRDVLCATRDQPGAGPPAVRARRLPAGTYFVAVTTGVRAGSFRLTFLATPPAPARFAGDRCPGRSDPATAVDLADGAAHTVALTTAEDDVTLACARTLGPARDAVYPLEVRVASRLRLVARAAHGVTAVALRQFDCDDPASELACVVGAADGAPITVAPSGALVPGRYWVWIENSAAVDVIVQATLEPLVATDLAERCPGRPIALTTEPGDASWPGADDIFAGAPRHTQLPACLPGPHADAIFQFTLSARRDVEANVALGASGRAFAQFFGACGVPHTALSPCATARSPVTARAYDLPAGTYYLVSAAASATGPHAVQLRTFDPATRAHYEACPGALLEVGGNATIEWDPAPGASTRAIGGGLDAASPCASVGEPAGRDVVLHYTLATAGDVELSVENAGAALYVSVRSSCAGTAMGDPLDCASMTGGGTYLLPAQAAGTYYVVLQTDAAIAAPSRVLLRVVGRSDADVVDGGP